MTTAPNSTNSDIIKRIEGLERRMEDIGIKASDSRDAMQLELHAIKLQMALGEQTSRTVSAQLDKLSVQVESLMRDSLREAGVTSTWAKVIDPLLKVLVAVGVAYLVVRLGLK